MFALTTALDAKWTPNGEAPAPFSTKARQQTGMNPAAFAGQGQAPLTPPSGGLRLTLGSLVRASPPPLVAYARSLLLCHRQRRDPVRYGRR